MIIAIDIIEALLTVRTIIILHVLLLTYRLYSKIVVDMPFDIHLQWKPLIMQALLHHHSLEAKDKDIACTDVECELSESQTLKNHFYFTHLPYLTERGYANNTVYLIEATLWNSDSSIKFITASFVLPSLEPDTTTMDFEARWENEVDAFIVQRIGATATCACKAEDTSVSTVNADALACSEENIRKCELKDASIFEGMIIDSSGSEALDSECVDVNSIDSSHTSSESHETPSSQNMDLSSFSTSPRQTTSGEGGTPGQYPNTKAGSIGDAEVASSDSKLTWDELKTKLSPFNWADEDEDEESFLVPAFPPQPSEFSCQNFHTIVHGENNDDDDDEDEGVYHDNDDYDAPEASHEEYVAMDTVMGDHEFVTTEEDTFMRWQECLGNVEMARQSHYIYQSDGEIHHFNYQGEPVEVESRTIPEQSFAVLWCGPKVIFEASHGDDFTRESVARACAMKYLDPVIFRGDRELLKWCQKPSDIQSVAAAPGATRKFYTPLGRWTSEPATDNVHAPEADCCDPITYSKSPDEIVVNGWFRDQMTDTKPVTLRDAFVDAFWDSQKAQARRDFVYKPSRLSFCETLEYDLDDEESTESVEETTMELTTLQPSGKGFDETITSDFESEEAVQGVEQTTTPKPMLPFLDVPFSGSSGSSCPDLIEYDSSSSISEYSEDEPLSNTLCCGSLHITNNIKSASYPTVPTADLNDRIRRLTRTMPDGNSRRASSQLRLTYDQNDTTAANFSPEEDGDTEATPVLASSGRESRTGHYNPHDYEDCSVELDYDDTDDQEIELDEGYHSSSTNPGDSSLSPALKSRVGCEKELSPTFLIHSRLGLLPQLIPKFPLSVTNSLQKEKQSPATHPRPQLVAVKQKVPYKTTETIKPPMTQFSQLQLTTKQKKALPQRTEQPSTSWAPWTLIAGFVISGVVSFTTGGSLLL